MPFPSWMISRSTGAASSASNRTRGVRRLRAGTSRRSFLGSSLFGLLSLAASPMGRHLLAADGERKKAKACILIFLEGGPSHIDTFDPKPGQPTGGSFQAIDTAVDGLKFSEHFPKLAAAAKRLAVVRSLTSHEGDHDRATTLVHTGYAPTGILNYPSLGAMVARERSAADDAAPPFVSMFTEPGAGFFGPEFGPFQISDVQNPAANLELPEGLAEERLAARLKALEQVNGDFGRRTDASVGRAFTRLTQQANRLRQSEALKPLDTNEEAQQLLERYGSGAGDGNLARACCIARRMVEHEVKFVEIGFGGWDTHADNFNQVQQLSAQLDAALATLIAELADHGQLHETLVACFGEFGRTPQINGDNGRDHWSDAFAAVLAGGGLKSGVVVGKTDEKGGQVADRPVTIPELHATLLSAFGIDPAKVYQTPDGRPIHLTNKGKPVAELFS